MKNTHLILRDNIYIKKMIKNNILHNDYYGTLRRWYKKSKGDEKIELVNQVFNAYDRNFNGYYSVYTIMNAIEEYLQENKNCESICDALDDDEFEIPFNN